MHSTNIADTYLNGAIVCKYVCFGGRSDEFGLIYLQSHIRATHGLVIARSEVKALEAVCGRMIIAGRENMLGLIDQYTVRGDLVCHSCRLSIF